MIMQRVVDTYIFEELFCPRKKEKKKKKKKKEKEKKENKEKEEEGRKGGNK